MDAADGHLSDETLIAQIRCDGDRDAFNLLHQRYRPRVLNYLFRFLGNFERAEDLTQIVFIKVYGGIPKLVSLENIPGWIYRIAGNFARMEFRRRRRHRSEEALSLNSLLPGKDGKTIELADIIGSDFYRPDWIIQRRNLEAKVERAILRLAPALREVLILCIFQGLSYRKVAEILNIRSKTVGTRLFRARRSIGEYMNSTPDE